MRYALLVYADPSWSSRPPEDMRALHEASRALHYAYHGTAAATIVAHYRLRPPEQTTTVRIAENEVTRTEGAATEATAALRALYLIDSDDTQAVLELAERLPAIHMGGRVEIWPLIVPEARWQRTASCAHTHRRSKMTSIQPELWVDTPREALAFYEAAFGATILHCVGDGDDIVAQLGVGDAAFWVAPTSSTMKRLSPRAINGATSRTLLVVEDPDTVVQQAVAAGATETSPVGDEHGWRLGRIIDPFGHEWEIGAPLGAWPPS